MNTIGKIRYILNILFLVGCVATIILYVLYGECRPFYYAGFTSLFLKILEFILRFVY